MGSRTCPITIDASNIERDTYQKSPFHVSTSSWRVSHDSGIWTSWSVSGDFPENAAPLSIVVNNNPFWQSVEDGTPESMVRGRTETMLRYMWVAQGKVAYIDNVPQINPFRCTVHVPYYFRAGDRVKIIDPLTSEEYHSYVTDVTWTFRGGQQISCAGEDTRTLSVSTSRNGAKKISDYSRYLYRKSKSNTGGGGGDANTYTKAEIDAKDAVVKSAADKAQGTADGAVSVNNTQNTQIAALKKSAHTHNNKGVLDKIEQPYTTAERDKLAGLENYTHPAHTAHAKGFYKFASDGEGHVADAEKVTKEDITALGIPSENTRYKFAVDGTGLEINQSTSSEFYRLKFPSTRSITSLIPYFPNTYDNGRGYCWCQLAFTVVESTAHDYKKIGIEGGYEQGERIYYEPQGVAKIAIALYGVAGRRGVSITADLPLHNAKMFEVRPLENLKIFSSAPEKKLSVYAVGRYSSIDTAVGGKTNYDLYLFLYADESYTATAPGVRVTVETSVYPFVGSCSNVNQNYSNVVQLDSSVISESIRMSAAKVEAVTDILASKADKSEIPDISGKQDKLTAGTNITISGSTISAKDTTYSDATQSTHGLMTAADKKKLDGMDLSKYLPKDGTAKKAESLSNGQMRSAFCYNANANFSNGYIWFKIGTATLSGRYATIATTFLCTCGWGKHALYTCRVRLASAGNAVESMSFFESGRTGSMPTGLFRVVAINGEKNVTFELWAKVVSQYEGTRVVILNEMNLGGANNGIFWALTSKSSADAKQAPTSGDVCVDSTDNSICATTGRAETLTDSGWTATTKNTTFTATSTVQCRKYGQFVEVRGEVTFSSTYGSPTVCTLPAGYRPAAVVQTCGYTPSGKIFCIKVDTAGVVSFSSDAAGTFVKSTTYRIDLTYLLG